MIQMGIVKDLRRSWVMPGLRQAVGRRCSRPWHSLRWTETGLRWKGFGTGHWSRGELDSGTAQVVV